MAEGAGLEPARAFARRFSRAVHYHSANPPSVIIIKQKIALRNYLNPKARFSSLPFFTTKKI